MAESFEIVLSRVISLADLRAALAEMIPLGLRVDVRGNIGELPDEPGAIWAVTVGTDDAAWPNVLDVLVLREDCGLGPYPDLRIASKLWEQFETDALCGTYPFIGELDPQDPYWALALISGEWHLASTAGTLLMGPYSDGKRHNEPVRLVRPVSIPND